MKILLFGGTRDARVLALRLRCLGAQVTVSVATPLGAEELSCASGLTVLVGRRDAGEIETLLSGFDLCIDATHPYASDARVQIRQACQQAGKPMLRLLYPASPAEGAVCVDSSAQAAAFLADKTGNILLTTGSKELAPFAALDTRRLFVRVLPTHESIAACEAIGIAHRRILAMQGPFSQELNEATIRQFHIAWVVTKDGGKAGGFEEKRLAARSTGAGLVMIRRPDTGGETLEEILEKVSRMMETV